MGDTQTAVLEPAASLQTGKNVFGPLIKRFKAMLGWRLLAMAAAAAGNIWASRCLGPENLGMSAAVQAISTQALLFTHFGQNNFLIRTFKHTANEAQLQLVENVVVLRVFFSLLIAVVAIVAVAIHGVPSLWMLPIGAGIALFLLEAQTPDWLLQAQENQTVIYRAALFGALLGTSCYFIFFRPGVSPGANLVVACASALLVRILTYRAALSKLGSPRFRLEQLRPALDLLWRGRIFFATAAVISVYTQCEQLIVAYYRPINELGIYKSALQLTGTATPIFGIVTALLYPRFIEWRKQGSAYLWKRQVQLGSASLVVWLVAAAIIIPTLPLIYPVVFGAQFTGGALPCAILLLSRMLVIPVSIFIYSLWAHGKDKLMLALTSITAVVSLTLNLSLIPTHGIVFASLTNLASECLMLVLGILMSRRLRNSDATPIPVS